jgi:hypothetical protein
MSIDLANKAYNYAITTIDTTTIEIAIKITTTTSNPFVYISNTKLRYTSAVFIGIMIDTRASKKSTASCSQFQALQATEPSTKLDTTTRGQANIQFGIGTTSSIRLIEIDTLIGRIQFYIVEANIPFLLCLANIDRL